MKSAPKITAFLVSLALCAGARAAVPELIPGITMPIATPGAEITQDVMPREPKFQVAQDFVPLEIILQALRNEYGGHQLTVGGPSRSGDNFVYRIKWLTEDGAVLYVTADAESGEVLSLEGE